MRKLLPLFALLLAPVVVRPQTPSCITATCTAAGVDATSVINALPSSGTVGGTVTVNIPSGTGSWTVANGAGFIYTIPSSITSLIIQGNTTIAGTYAQGTVVDNSIIVDNSNSGPYLLTIRTASVTQKLRVTGLTFKGGTGTSQKQGFWDLQGSSLVIRFDHNHIDSTTNATPESGLQLEGCTAGVIDHNFINQKSGDNTIRIYNGQGCNGDPEGNGNGNWAAPDAYGTSNFFYVESNTIQGAGNDCTQGGRYVWRFNNQTSVNGQLATQTHPTGGGFEHRGCRVREVYENLFQANPTNNFIVNTEDWASSGTMMYWGNNLGTTGGSGSQPGTYGFKNAIQIHSMRQNNATYTEGLPPTQGWGYCGNSSGLPGDNSAIDGSTGTGYPCLDQPGRGQGQVLTGLFASSSYCPACAGSGITNASTGTFTWPNQALDPTYEWMTTIHTIPSNTVLLYQADTNSTTLNVDLYLGTAVTAPFAPITFTGATGVGVGTRASRPATCTTGVGYFSTDQGSWNTSGGANPTSYSGQGVLDKCTATNTWTNGAYTPFTFPHPLTSGASQVATPTFSPAPGPYALQQTITISCATAGATLCVTIDGSTPTESANACTNGFTYTTPFSTVTSGVETIKVLGTKATFLDSTIPTGTYTIAGGFPVIPAPAPAFTYLRSEGDTNARRK